MSSEDPLLALRQAIASKSPINYAANSEPTASLANATHLILGSTSLPKDTRTRLRKPGSTATDPATSSQDFFPLDAVYLAWLLRDASSADYMKQARENGLAVGFVSVTERKGLVDWLEGRTATHASIIAAAGESTTPPGTPPPQSRYAALPLASSSAPPQASPSKRRYVPDSTDLEVVKKIRANEIELQDRKTVLRGIKPNNFSNLKQLYSEKLKKLKQSGKPGAAPTAAPIPDPKMVARKQKNLYPIIMISSSPTALITMHNVKRFLQESVFEPSLDARARAAAEGIARPEDMIPIYRKRTTIDASGRETETQVRYAVVDGVEALAKLGVDAWDRVVCVMTTGQAWQFRKYKWPEPKALFHHVKGMYFTWSNDPPNPLVKDWNVTDLKIDRNRRHVDKAVVAQFWKTLDAWTQANKPWLMKT